MNKEELENLLKKEFSLTDTMLQQLDTYFNLLVETSKVMNLTTLTSVEDVYIKHYYDSLLLAKTVDLRNKTLADVGTGAGFPGLVLKICYPSLKVTLIEPTTKRCNFLKTVIDTLNLKDVNVINDRAEKYISIAREQFDYVTARAVSQLNILAELCVPFAKVNGKFIALKGSNVEEEILASKNAIQVLKIKQEKIVHFDLPNNAGSREIIIYNKEASTLAKYPRDYAMIKKKPL